MQNTIKIEVGPLYVRGSTFFCWNYTRLHATPKPPNPYAPDNLFALLPGVQMVWAVSGAAMRVQVDASDQEPLIDQLPPGEYLILRVTAPIVDTPGFYQVPAPPRKSRV